MYLVNKKKRFFLNAVTNKVGSDSTDSKVGFSDASISSVTAAVFFLAFPYIKFNTLRTFSLNPEKNPTNLK